MTPSGSSRSRATTQPASSAGTVENRLPWIAAAVVLGLLAVQLGALGRVPFISEDWTQMAEMRAVPTFFGALDPSLEPLRPFQHAFFWVIAHCGGHPSETTMPFVAHAFAFLLQAGSCACVWFLAREAGARRLGALAACVLFAVFPNVKTLAWSAAIGTPGRTFIELAALLLLARHARSARPRDAILGLLAFALSLGFHESAMLLPAILVLWIVFVQGATWREGLSKLWRAARDPWLLAFALAAFVYAVQLVLRPQRHHGLKSFASLPANIVKGETALAPEWIRTLVVDGFRAGTSHALAFATAGVLFVAIAVLVVVLARRSQVARFVLCASAIDLGLAVIGAGFVQRYAYWSSALVAIGLGVWIGRDVGLGRPSQARVAANTGYRRQARAAVVIVLGAWWVFDTAIDVRDIDRIGPTVTHLVQVVHDVRERGGPSASIVIVDPPDMTGTERDVPLFNWGLDYLLEGHGLAGPWRLWRTRPYATGTNVELVDPARVESARAEGTLIIEAAHVDER